MTVFFKGIGLVGKSYLSAGVVFNLLGSLISEMLL